jgi:hypothetical protein
VRNECSQQSQSLSEPPGARWFQDDTSPPAGLLRANLRLKLECRHDHSLWVAGRARFRMAGVHSAFPSEMPSRLSSMSRLNPVPFHAFNSQPLKHADDFLLLQMFRGSNQHAQRKPNSLVTL